MPVEETVMNTSHIKPGRGLFMSSTSKISLQRRSREIQGESDTAEG
jgi:hypothetical protein